MFILHDLDATTMDQGAIVEELEGYGVGGLFVTTVEYYGFNALWEQFVRSVAGG